MLPRQQSAPSRPVEHKQIQRVLPLGASDFPSLRPYCRYERAKCALCTQKSHLQDATVALLRSRSGHHVILRAVKL